MRHPVVVMGLALVLGLALRPAAAEDAPPEDPFAPGEEEPDEFAPPEPPPEIFLPPVYEPPLPFSRGDMEIGAGIGLGLGGTDMVLAVGGLFAYYVVDGLAPGLEVDYTTVFSDQWEYPDTLRTLPFLKWVVYRSRIVSPYVVAMGGREFQWGEGDPVDAWIAGGGGGVHIGVGDHVAIKIQLLALYYWYDSRRVYGYDDRELATDPASGDQYFPDTCDASGCLFLDGEDEADVDAELLFPLLSVGVAILF